MIVSYEVFVNIKQLILVAVAATLLLILDCGKRLPFL